ncbi:hypothetical protein B0T10DRAFT_499261 [Thelonectria olida]|uniref:Uncharacterized protein n=1 Tax=Thelonectria olida TaxID=1576542 RepID=A0A9P8VR72_9HYPO|nr:hypothetical protein B0T10DRAFT_499261 [Thelonectria olida]
MANLFHWPHWFLRVPAQQDRDLLCVCFICLPSAILAYPPDSRTFGFPQLATACSDFSTVQPASCTSCRTMSSSQSWSGSGSRAHRPAATSEPTSPNNQQAEAALRDVLERSEKLLEYVTLSQPFPVVIRF